VKLVDEIGLEHMMWSVDYPHPEGNLGENVEVMRSLFEQLGPTRAMAVAGGNAAQVWRLDLDALRAAVA
jgi:predicted TIM-barrel fold metal-dependent hydrolase